MTWLYGNYEATQLLVVAQEREQPLAFFPLLLSPSRVRHAVHGACFSDTSEGT